MPHHYTDSIFYHGLSMYPTLRTFDRIVIRGCTSNNDIHIGDIIVFKGPEASHMVIHRTIGFVDGGYLTKGDNNKFTDPWIVAKRDIVGCVERVYRGKKTRYVLGGKIGLVYAFMLTLFIGFWRPITRSLRSPYFWLSEYSFLKKVTKSCGWLTLREFDTPRGNEAQAVLFGRLIIARRLPKNNKWKIRKPFHLLCDEKMLN